jgi:glucan phosphoethanolaminetransferase (alkaline phosphatase superfamily)
MNWRRLQQVQIAALSLLLWAPTLWMAHWALAGYRVRGALTVLTIGLLIAILTAVCTRAWRKFFLVLFPLFMLSMGFLIYTLSFRMPPGHTLSMILVGASWEELRGFLGMAQGRALVPILLGGALIYLSLSVTIQRAPIFTAGMKNLSRLAVMSLIPLGGYCAWNSGELIDGMSLNPMLGSLLFLGATLPDASREVHGGRVHKIPYGAHRQGGEEVHILIVGESVRRASWSAYGYGRPTTPYLDGLKSEAIFFENAVADANLTESAVPILMTGMTPENFDAENIRGNILDLAKEGGYSTSWLVNQDISISTALGVSPDHLINPPDVNATINGRHTLDEVLLPGFQAELARKGAPRFIGIHMMGSHWEYYRRYPPKFRRFGSGKDLGMLAMVLDDENTKKAVLDSYDNSIVYTDWFLQQIIEPARKLTVPVTVTFFPDHGEDLQILDGQSGHGQPAYTQHAFEIPAFIWVNDAYKMSHPRLVETLKANSTKEVRTHNVFYTLADLMGITWSGAVATSSVASASFVPDEKMKHFAGGVLVTRQ